MQNNLHMQKDGIPMPIVNLNRSILALGILIALFTQQTWITTVLFLILLPTTLFGKRFSLIFRLGSWLFKRRNLIAEKEDPGLQRFNNSIATTLLAFAQLFFAIGQPIVAWVFAGMVMLASGIALAGFCIGCYLYYQYNIQRYRIFGP
jgi:hypothetical protein